MDERIGGSGSGGDGVELVDGKELWMMKVEYTRDHMNELLEEAEGKGYWLYYEPQELWFSPQELRRYQAEGRFRWGAVNWQVRSPYARLAELIVKADIARDAVAGFVRELKGEGLDVDG